MGFGQAHRAGPSSDAGIVSTDLPADQMDAAAGEGRARNGRTGTAGANGRTVPEAKRAASASRTGSIVGAARVDSRTKRLVTRLQPGEIAVVNHADLDRVAAQALIAGGARAVVNAAPSTTGRYPNLGPLLLVESGVRVIDCAGEAMLAEIDEGTTLTLTGGEVWVSDRLVATGRVQTAESLRISLAQAKARLGEELARFAENTLEYLRRERHLMLERSPLPDVGVDVSGRHVLVAVRGTTTQADLAMLRPYIREMRPVLIAVDGGADALVGARLVPDIILGDFDSVTTSTLRCGARLVVHGYPGGEAPGAARLDALGLDYIVVEAPGVSEDVAMLLAYEKDAELIVAVGAHASMEEFLDKGRAGMASTFLTRLIVGGMLVDAKGVARLYQGRVRKRDLAAFLASIVFLLIVVIIAFPATRVFADSFWFTLTEKLQRR